MEKKLIFAFGFLATVTAGVLLVHPTIKYVNADSDNPSVKICHGNTDVNSPYITENPNIQNDGSLSGGHQDHTGPLASSLSVAQALKTAHTQWGDIIPPYNFYTCPNGYTLNGTVCTKKSQPNVNATPGSYAGLNWTADGQAMWSNNCAYVTAPTATPTPTSVQPTATPTPTGAPTATPTVTVTDTPTPTTTTTSNGGGDNGDGLGCATHDCSTHPATTQAVLGASTMASTGTFEENAMNLAALLGVILMSSSVLYKKFQNKFSFSASKIA